MTSYCGGWKMKMQLCATQLLNCGVLMRIEPTGHLDVVYIKWLKDWLESFAGNMLTMLVRSPRRKGVLRNELRRLRSCGVVNTRCGGHRGSSCCVIDACSSCECEAQHQLVFLAVCRISGVSFSRVHSGTMQVTIVATVFQETLESCASTLRRLVSAAHSLYQRWQCQ